MIKIAFIVLLMISPVHAADAPKQVIESAEQASTRFREALDTELKASLTEGQYKFVVHMMEARSHHAYRMHPQTYKQLLEQHPVRDDPAMRIFGTFTDAVDCKNDTWGLSYDTGGFGGLSVILDAVTGKVLCIQNVMEG